jgi:universal stress protein A
MEQLPMSPPFQSILVPLQFDDGSLPALRLARDLALRDHAKLVLLHVLPLREAAFSEQHYCAVEQTAGAEAWAEDEARRKLEAAAVEALRSEVPYATVTRVGDPVGEILRAEKELGVDLVVMATHGRKGVWRVALGSVVEKVVRSSTCPVLTTAPEERA